MQEAQTHVATEPQEHQAVDITVNNKPVHLPKRAVTGQEIKAAAIAQGVAIQPDFLLYTVGEHGQLDPVRDDQVVHLHEHEQFRAVTPDDVSSER